MRNLKFAPALLQSLPSWNQKNKSSTSVQLPMLAALNKIDKTYTFGSLGNFATAEHHGDICR